MVARVVQLHIYPVKSFGGIAVTSMPIGARGPRFDRQWMVVERATRAFLTQRQIPKMTLVQTHLVDHQMQLSWLDKQGQTQKFSTSVDAAASLATFAVQIWNDVCQAVEADAEISLALSDYFERDVALVTIAPHFQRALPVKYAPNGGETGFADGFPLLLTSLSSLKDLNSRLENQVGMDRFRSNIVIDGAAAFAEESWSKIRIGAVEFELPKKCARCVIINTDQTTGARSAEPLKTLHSYHQSENGKAVFGQNMIHCQQGTLHVGDEVSVLA